MDVWKSAKTAPTDTWVVGYFPGSNEYAEIRYTHEHGWRDRAGDHAAPPSVWAPLPFTRQPTGES